MSVPFLCPQAIFYSLGKAWREPRILRPAIRDVKRKAGRDRRSLRMPYVVHLGERLVIFALYRIKVAFVCRPEQVDPRKFGTLVAQNRGVTVETFTDFQAAEEWLLGKPPWA